ncbi:MAG: hypothetical protein MRY74_14130 [Neomegalonema sp.]|nr:hypothetical protein [Neomegalonema sp.]
MICALATASLDAALAETPAKTEPKPTGPIVGVRADVSSWRLIDGKGVVGVMGVGPFLNLGAIAPLTPEGLLKAPRVGYFVIQVEGRGVFEGVFNLKKGGSQAIGVFWPEGRKQGDVITGFLDLESLKTPGEFGGAGTISFSDDGATIEVSAR